jgi:hypothetical protein
LGFRYVAFGLYVLISSGSVSSTPLTQAVGDIEKLRVELGIEKWLVFGGSWCVPRPQVAYYWCAYELTNVLKGVDTHARLFTDTP